MNGLETNLAQSYLRIDKKMQAFQDVQGCPGPRHLQRLKTRSPNWASLKSLCPLDITEDSIIMMHFDRNAWGVKMNSLLEDMGGKRDAFPANCGGSLFPHPSGEGC